MDAFKEFSILFFVTAILGYIAIKLKLPSVLGYIFSGFLIGTLFSNFSNFNLDDDLMNLLSNIGVTLLLFTLGLELNLSIVKSFGKISVITGLGQIFFTSIVGYIICILLGFNHIVSLFMAIGLTFSSTVIIVKLLSMKNQLDSLHGKISVGFLLVQDFVAILALILMSTLNFIEFTDFNEIWKTLLIAFLKGVVLIVFVFVIARLVLFKILDSLKQEKEMMFIIVIAWALIISYLFSSEYIGFTKEIGGLIAGMALANRFENLQLESWTKPIRDFFLALFFVLLGTNINISSFDQVVLPAIILSLFVLIGNPLIVMFLMGLYGYDKKTSFLTSLVVAQISEFSLIIMSYAYSTLGLVDNESLTIMALVGGITMTVSSYLIYYDEFVYKTLKPLLVFFEFRKSKALFHPEVSHALFDNKKILLCGCHRMGKRLLKSDIIGETLVIELDITKVKKLKDKGIDVLFGDISNSEFLKTLPLDQFEVIISTVPNFQDNASLLKFIRSINSQALKVVTASNDEDAIKLYKMGADFVLYPHLLGSRLLNHILDKRSLDINLVRQRRTELDELEKYSEISY